MRRRGSARLAGMVSGCLMVTTAALAGCMGKGPTDVVETELRSPDGTMAAYVVMRSERTADKGRMEREFVVVLPNGQPPLGRADLVQIAPMQATGLYGLRLEWSAVDAVRVVCESCGLPAGKVLRQAEHAGAVKMDYQGFGKGAVHG